MNFNKLRKAIGVVLLSGALIGVSYAPALSQESVSQGQYKRTTCILDGSPKCKKPGNECNEWKACPGLKDWIDPAVKIAGAVASIVKG